MADVKKTVQIDLEVDTNTVDSSHSKKKKMVNHLAKAVDALRIFPKSVYHHIYHSLYKVVVWYMALPSPTMEQSGLVSVVVGAGAAWFGLYAGTSKKKD